MALIHCSECGMEISSSAECCPHCGHKTEFAAKTAQKKDKALATYIALAAVALGLILLIPNMFTLADNYNDWYFWNWYTERSDAVVRSIGWGVGLTGGGLGVLLGLKRLEKKSQTSTTVEET